MAAMLRAMNIRWQEAELDETGFMAGHGLGFYRLPTEADDRQLLIAFVEDFAWLRGTADPVVLFAPARWPTDAGERESLRRAAEEFLRARHLHGDFAPGYFALANA